MANYTTVITSPSIVEYAMEEECAKFAHSIPIPSLRWDYHEVLCDLAPRIVNRQVVEASIDNKDYVHSVLSDVFGVFEWFGLSVLADKRPVRLEAKTLEASDLRVESVTLYAEDNSVVATCHAYSPFGDYPVVETAQQDDSPFGDYPVA